MTVGDHSWQDHWRGKIELQPLGPLTTMGVGGPAVVATVEDEQDLAIARQLDGRWLGRGANLLIGAAGVAEPVLRLGRFLIAVILQQMVW